MLLNFQNPLMLTSLPSKTFPYLALVAGVLSLGMSAIFVRWAGAPGPITAFYRVTISLILLTPFFLARSRKNGGIKKSVLSIPILGGILTSIDFAFWYTSLSYTTAANATLLGNTAPLWVALGAWVIFHERLNKTFWVGLAIALSGATLIIGFDFLTEIELGIGDILAIISGIFYGGYFLTTQRGREHFDPLSYVWVVSLSASIGLGVINLGLGHSFTGYSAETWGYFLAAGIISQTIGYISVSYALGHLPASVVSPSMIGQPIMTTLFAIPLLGEIPNTVQIIGGSIALVGIFLVNRAYQNREKNLRM